MRFAYRYQYTSDTLNKSSLSEETVILDCYPAKNRSVFTGLKHIISDSTMTADAQRGVMSYPEPSEKVRYIIEKTPDHLYYYTPDHQSNEILKVEDDRKQVWNIVKEEDIFLGHRAQKAETFFGGRYWTAWFTTDIPISDGPYKFKGLPGLILKISDQTGGYSFEITAIQKKNTEYDILDEKQYKIAKPVSFITYRKMYKSDLEAFKIKALNGDVIFKDNNDKQAFLKDIENNIKQDKIHNNNPIER